MARFLTRRRFGAALACGAVLTVGSAWACATWSQVHQEWEEASPHRAMTYCRGLGTRVLMFRAYDPVSKWTERLEQSAGWPVSCLTLTVTAGPRTDGLITPFTDFAASSPFPNINPNTRIIRVDERSTMQYPGFERGVLPIRPLWGGLAACTAFWTAATLSAMWAPGATTAAYRRWRCRCPGCGYPREGLAGNAACPECGANTMP